MRNSYAADYFSLKRETSREGCPLSTAILTHREPNSCPCTWHRLVYSPFLTSDQSKIVRDRHVVVASGVSTPDRHVLRCAVCLVPGTARNFEPLKAQRPHTQSPRPHPGEPQWLLIEDAYVQLTDGPASVTQTRSIPGATRLFVPGT